MLSWLFKKKSKATTAEPTTMPEPFERVPVIDYEDERIPDNSRPLIAQIRFLIGDIEERSVQQPIFSPMINELRQMREQHLPRMLISYFEIPPQHRAEIFRRSGKSASYMLTESLQKMADRLDEMSKSMAKDNIDAFTSNLRFIEMRYGDDYSLS